MNLPGGITLRDGNVVDVQPLAVFFNRAFWYESLHMLLAAYIVAGFFVAGVYAAGMLKGRRDRYHRIGFLVPFTVAAVVIAPQIFVGDVAAREVFHNEPAKFATMEMLSATGDHVPERILGVLSSDGKVRYALSIPSGASLLAGFSRSTRIQGLNALPPQLRPRPRLATLVHWSFDVMVGTGFLLLGLALWFGVAWWRRRDLPRSRWFLRCAALSGLVSVVALEMGWVVTEVGRQPWTVVGLLLTRDAVATSGNIWFFFAGTLVIYAAIGTGAVLALRIMHQRWRARPEEDVGVPYGPAQPVETTTPEGRES
jgi:cytochrome d ubiquinol oxidase subunit I